VQIEKIIQDFPKQERETEREKLEQAAKDLENLLNN